MIGINMLRVADNQPQTLQRCFEAVAGLTEKGVFTPVIGKIFPVDEIAAAHEYLEKRKSMGKVVVVW